MSKAENKTCPKSVIQERFEVSNGMPLTFSPSDKSKVIGVSTDLNFKFSATSIWNLDNVDEKTNQWFIGTCGVEGIQAGQLLVTGSRSTSTKITTRSCFVLLYAISAESCVETLVCLCKMGLEDLC
ncbi:hypothetical protein Bca52824_013526 [Brassica carinata]|uniref:Uncharacterized protein n=1 Tax=Brassica carinata TaxID=52824 RepID=A0A8X7VY87_BRACI|nr:hypothetical protein Bca52824_013526 [Brassica carinata]